MKKNKIRAALIAALIVSERLTVAENKSLLFRSNLQAYGTTFICLIYKRGCYETGYHKGIVGEDVCKAGMSCPGPWDVFGA